LAAEVLQRTDALQLLGDGLLTALDQHAEGARALSDGLIFEAIRPQLIEIGEAVKRVPGGRRGVFGHY
jgi:hypothetical protein